MLRKLLEFVRALGREISDESAYARYLERTGQQPSAEAWREFSEQRYRRKYQNPKCC